MRTIKIIPLKYTKYKPINYMTVFHNKFDLHLWLFFFIIVDIKTKRGNIDSHKAEEYTTKKQCYFLLTPQVSLIFLYTTHMYVHT